MSSIEALPQTVSIELPLKVKSPEKALKAIGGAAAIASVVNHPEKQLELRLRYDQFHHPINSHKSDSSNVVLEIKVPTWAMEKANGNIQEALALAKGGYSARPALLASLNYKFREMADFQYYTEGNPLVERLENSIMSGNLQNILKYKVTRETPTELLPPPRFSQQTQPVFYNFKQPSSVAVIKNSDGEVRLINKTKSAALKSHVIQWDDPVPTKPRDDLEPNPRQSIKNAIEELKVIFSKRPSYTRRAINALLSDDSRKSVRYALPYVAFFYRSGPWRAAYVKYGIDPRSDKAMAPYQVEHYRFTNHEEPTKPEDAVWTFDGKKLPTTRMLQLCDIDEPFLKGLISKIAIKDSVTEADGWYERSGMAAVRKVLKTQLEAIRDNREPLSTERLQEIADDAQSRGDSAPSQQPSDSIREEEEEEEEEEEDPEDPEEIEEDEHTMKD